MGRSAGLAFGPRSWHRAGGRLLVVGAAAALLAVTVPSAATEQVENESGAVARVAFSTTAEPYGPNGIAVVTLADGETRVLTDPQGDGVSEQHVTPTLHPDGIHLAYASERPDGPVIRVRDLSTDVEVTVGAGSAPVWSPDGRWLAHVRHVDGAGELVVRPVTGPVVGAGRVLHRHDSRLSLPAWAPLGDRIGVYASQRDAQPTGGYDDTSVVVVDVLDGTSAVVSGTVGVEPTPMSWAPDGGAVAAVGRVQPGEGGTSALLLPVDGTGPRVLFDGEIAFGVRFAPDGTVVWALAQDADELLALSPEGGVVRRLLLQRPREDDQLLIAPDGRTAVLGMGAGTDDGFAADLFEIDLASGEARRLTTDGAYAIHSAAAHWPGLSHRVGGDDRIETVLELVRRIFDRVDCVVVARADDFADALTAGPLAASLDAPLLLTPPDRLDERVADEIERLEATCAILVGGLEALAQDVADALRGLGLDVERIAGEDRFAVAAAIADRVGTQAGAYLVEGAHPDPNRGWPDAVAIGGLAGAQQRPILLTVRDHLPDATKRALDDLDSPRVDIVGGTAAVAREVEDGLQRDGITVTRIAGADRYETSRRVVELATAVGLDPRAPMVVTGRAWADALTAGVAGAAAGHPVLLVDGEHTNGGLAAREWLAGRSGQLDVVRIIGGPAAINPPVATTIEAIVAPT